MLDVLIEVEVELLVLDVEILELVLEVDVVIENDVLVLLVLVD